MRTIHVGLPDRTQAQYSEDQLRALWDQARIPQNALYWIEGMPEWRPITELLTQSPAQPFTPSPMAPAAPVLEAPQSGNQQSPYQQATNQPSGYQQEANQQNVGQPAGYPPPNYQQPNYQAPGNYKQPEYQAPSPQPVNYEQPHYGAPRIAQPAPIGGPYAGQQGVRAFVKDPSGLTRRLQSLLWMMVGLAGIAILSESATIMSSGNSDRLTSTRLGALTAFVGLVTLVFTIITMVHFFKWIHRANTNVRGFGAQGLEFAPAWAVGYFFIPFLNLVKPYQAMAEIWRASRSPAKWKSEGVGSLVGIWWGIYLVSHIFAYVIMRVGIGGGQTVQDAQMVMAITILSDFLDIGASIATIQLIKQIYQMQVDYVEHRS